MTAGIERPLGEGRTSHASRSVMFTLLIVTALGLALAAPALVNLVVASGRFIPQQNLTTDYMIGVIWAALLGISVIVWPVRASDKPALLWVWLIKCFVTLGFMLLYEGNYYLDAYHYFDLPRRSWYASQGFGLGTGTDNMIILSWLHQQVLPNSYHALKVSCAMVGLVAVYIFYRAAEVYLGRGNQRILYVLAFFPSILFWSSILGKDPIVLLGMAIYAFGFIAWYRLGGLRYAVPVALGAAIAITMRPWLALILFPPLAVVGVRLTSGTVRRVGVFLVASVIAVLLLDALLKRFQLTTIQDGIAALDVVARAWATGGSGQEQTRHFTGVGSMLAFIPLGAFTALFRPLPGEVANPFGLLAGLENLVLLILLGLAIIRTRRQDLHDPVVIWAIVLLVAWATVYGFISYQNLGSAVRFKLQILPVLLLILLHLTRRRLTEPSATLEAN